MAIDEARRRALERRLEDVLGPEHARTLMDQVPGGAPATKGDLEAMGDGLSFRMDGIEARMDALEARMGEMEARLNERIDLRCNSVKNEMLATFHEGIGGLRVDMMAQTKTFVFATVGALASIAALGIAALRFG